MSALPQGWDFDYDGVRWFYTYKPTGHIQYHFPNEGDEFPDFVDAASPAPALAPEERLESQRQQVRRAASLNHQSHVGAFGGGASSSSHGAYYHAPGASRSRSHHGARAKTGGMSAKATPVSYIWEEEHPVESNEPPVPPESFMYLGPGTYHDISPMMEEEDVGGKRAAPSESSPGSSFLSPSDGRSRHASPPQGQWALPAQSPRFSPYGSDDGSNSMRRGSFQGTEMVSVLDTTGAVHLPDGTETVHMLDGTETIHMLDGTEAVHMLDGTSMVHMLDGREVPSELEGVTRFDPVGVVAEMGTPETAQARAEEDLVEMPAEKAMVPIEMVVVGDKDVKTAEEAEEEVQEALKKLEEETSSRGSGSSSSRPSPEPSDSSLRESSALEASREVTTDPIPDPSSSKPPPQPTFKIARKPTSGKYQPYRLEQSAEQRPRTSDDTASGQTALRRDPSLLIGTKRSEGDNVGTSSVPEVLALGQKQPQEAPRPYKFERSESDGQLASHPSVLNPSNRLSRESAGSPDTASSRKVENPADSTVEPDEEPAGITKFPSVLKPARGRAPSMPPRQTSSWPTEGLPRKCYEQADVNSGLEEGDRKYTPYRDTRPYSHIQSTAEAPDLAQASPLDADGPASTMSAAPEPRQPDEERHLPYRLVRPNGAEVHQPTSISATDGPHRPIAGFEAMPGLGFANGGVPSPASSDQTSPPMSPPKTSASPPEADSPDVSSLSASEDASVSSGTQQQDRSTGEGLRRGSSVSPHPPTYETAYTQTRSSSSDTIPSLPQLVLNQRRPSGLRHSISYDEAEESDMTSHLSSSGTTPVSAAPLSSAQDESPAHFSAVESLRRMSLPYSILEDSDNSPNTPPPLAKHPERPSLQRPKSRHGPSPDSAASGPADSPSPPVLTPALEVAPTQIEMGGHVLHAIEEDEEEPLEEIMMARRVFMKRHSVSSGSIQMTPPLASPNPTMTKDQQSAMSKNKVVSQPLDAEESPAPLASHQSPIAEAALRVNRHTMLANSNVGPAISHQRSASQPVSPVTRSGPAYAPQEPAELKFSTMQAPVAPLNRHDVPHIQLPNPSLYHQQPAQMQGTPPSGVPHQWYLSMPAPDAAGMRLGTTTQVSSPGQKDKEKGWKKIFRKSPSKETPPVISAPQPQPRQDYFPSYQSHPDVQHLAQGVRGLPAWQQAPPPQGTVQLPPAVGDRPGVSRIPGFEVTDVDAAPLGRMPTVRRHSALGSNPFDLSQVPAPLFDKETAP